MAKKLHSRPNLDHLRRQAKTLLAAIKAGDPEAIATVRKHLPAAKQMNSEQIRQAGFRLSDAQSAIARKTGFASWPLLSRHVDRLRALEGTWAFASLEVDGVPMSPELMSGSRILIDGDRFRTESPEAIYEGVFNINVEAEPNEIDIEFVEGPEAGNWNYGIFRLDGDRLEICLDINGKPRPMGFRTLPGSGQAFERLTRTSHARPDKVSGGTPAPLVSLPRSDRSGFDYVASDTLARLQGEWSAVKLVRDGQSLPPAMLASGHRSANGNELKITFGGQLVIHALVRINETAEPIEVDYYNLHGTLAGTIQYGVMKWVGNDACFNMAPPGAARPSDFECPQGENRILSQWRPKT